jgi:hypothetical protein
MIIFKYKENIIKFVICAVILLLTMIVVSKTLVKTTTPVEINDISTSVIEYKDDTTNIYVEYPRFYANNEINQIINDILYDYIKDFRLNENVKLLDISYVIKNVFNYVNVEFTIQDSRTVINNMNILFDLENNTQITIKDIYDNDLLKYEIYKLVKNNYPIEIYNEVIKYDINDFTYIFYDDQIYVYFNCIDLSNLDYVPSVIINMTNPDKNEANDPNIKKYIAFTYDDGPSQYTKELINILSENDSSATFFMLGNKMSNNDDIILQILSNNGEIGTNGFERKDYSIKKLEEINEDLNKTNEIYNSITKKNLSLLKEKKGFHMIKIQKYSKYWIIFFQEMNHMMSMQF